MSNCNRLSSLLFSSKLYMQGKTYFDANLIPAIEEALKEHEKSNCDTYRDLCAELLDQLYRSLPFVEDHEGSDLYKSGALSARIKSIKSAITKAESILGEKNGNSN